MELGLEGEENREGRGGGEEEKPVFFLLKVTDMKFVASLREVEKYFNPKSHILKRERIPFPVVLRGVVLLGGY